MIKLKAAKGLIIMVVLIIIIEITMVSSQIHQTRNSYNLHDSVSFMFQVTSAFTKSKSLSQ